ncbi:dihydroorotase [Oceanobacillus alkalisoli]|uniref:dihydroorotase n=1 Tax=Oceanobacillus alkalisoli TaxID=2925113 RepID=UPI001F11EE6A|nr:dihydroorotase [Oceanobacillus alkalisoli]MCF3942498.1 dihydroorotase [Oceanobacillus alkalisoli]
MKKLMKNIKLLSETGEIIQKEIRIDGNKISEIADCLSIGTDEVIDGKGKLALPGFIDLHIHLREPGGEHKETIKTGTKAAARGGFTTVAAMPNTNPVPDDQGRLDNLLTKVEDDAAVRVLPYASITKGLEGKELTDLESLTKAFAYTDDGVGVQTADLMLQAMKRAAKLGKAIVAHCEDNSIVYGGVVHDGEVSERLHLPGLPGISESVQIARDVLLAEKAGCHYHVCHVSTKESVRVIRDAKRAGINVTAEVTPHHLILNEQAILSDDANFKMNPPLRAKEDQEALLEGLLDGTLDFIATDHAPHAEYEKDLGFLQAPFGITGLETAFPLLYTHLVKSGKLSLKQLVDYLTIKPAEVFGLPYGRLEVAGFADIVLVDLTEEWTIDKDTFYSKGKNTPFNGWNVVGNPVLTIAEGKVVYQDEADIVHT